MALLLALAHANAAPLPELAWDWSRSHRFFVEAQVQIPQWFWMEAERNRSVRTVAWQVQAVMACSSTGEKSRKRVEVRCTLEDLGLRAATVAGDQGRALKVLEEYDQVLTGAAIELDMREDGKVTSYDVIGVQTRNLRTRGRLQTLRLLMRPLVAALEVRLPADGSTPWFYRESHLCQMPSLWGTLAPVEGVAAGTLRNGTVVEIAASSKGLMNPGENANLLTCETAERAFFTVGRGLARHTWEMHGDLTPGSPGALGVATLPYTQRGQLVRVEDGAAPPAVFGTDELLPDRLPSGVMNPGPLPPSR